jgi:hypothetical protein
VNPSAILGTNSKNWVARTIEYGIPDSRMSCSWACFARMYPLSDIRSAPTTDSTT